LSRFITDTHALHWHLSGDRRLSATARRLFQQADVGEHQILIPGIALIEMVYLVEKERLDASLVNRLLKLLDTVNGSYTVAPLDKGTAIALQSVNRETVSDMPDRIIAATARQLDLPLISRDSRISQLTSIEVIW
jgi:PIN domain nuclease of toxin-antitoxin system